MNFFKKALILISLPIIFFYISSSINSNVVNAAAPYKISGYVFIDTNKNGTKDSGELMYDTAKIEKWKDPSVANSKRYTADEVNYETMNTGTHSQSTGRYLFVKLTGGPNYKLKANVPQGFTCTTTNNCIVPKFNLNQDKVFIFGIKPTTQPPPPSNCKNTETNPIIDFGNNPIFESVAKGETATYNFNLKNNNCAATNYTLSVTRANGNPLPAGVTIEPNKVNGVSKATSQDVSLKLHTTAATPTIDVNYPYGLTIHAKSVAHPTTVKSTFSIMLAVTANTCAVDTDCGQNQYCNASSSVCVSGCGTSANNTCATGQVCTNHSCQATNANDCRIHADLCTGTQTCNQDTGICETPTGASSLSFIVGLDDIGATGDNSSSEFITPVVAPAHLSQPISVTLFKGTDETTAEYSPTGTITYSATTGTLGKFTATVPLPDNFVPGNYIVKITVPGHLTRQIPGIQNIQAGDNPMASVNLVTGDISGDNHLDIHDYSILIGCSNVSHSVSDTALCNSNADFKLLSDLNDDGAVDHFDVSILGREFYIQYGD